jgi:hypothetical protein
MRQAVAGAVYAVTLVWVAAVGPLCWLLRDGLGPGAVDSHGAEAVGRFLLTFGWGPTALALAAACLLVRGRRAGRGATDAEPRSRSQNHEKKGP